MRDTSACSALEVDNFMRYINLLTYLRRTAHVSGVNCLLLYRHVHTSCSVVCWYRQNTVDTSSGGVYCPSVTSSVNFSGKESSPWPAAQQQQQSRRHDLAAPGGGSGTLTQSQQLSNDSSIGSSATAAHPPPPPRRCFKKHKQVARASRPRHFLSCK